MGWMSLSGLVAGGFEDEVVSVDLHVDELRFGKGPGFCDATRGSYSVQLLSARVPGFYGGTTKECRCTPAIIQSYLGKISGPLLDRIDLHIEVPKVAYKELRGTDGGVTSDQMRDRVLRARARQQSRGYYNALLPPNRLRKLTALDDADERTLEMAVRRMGLSARAHDRILKVARTIADHAESDCVAAKHVAEAVQ